MEATHSSRCSIIFDMRLCHWQVLLRIIGILATFECKAFHVIWFNHWLSKLLGNSCLWCFQGCCSLLQFACNLTCTWSLRFFHFLPDLSTLVTLLTELCDAWPPLSCCLFCLFFLPCQMVHHPLDHHRAKHQMHFAPKYLLFFLVLLKKSFFCGLWTLLLGTGRAGCHVVLFLIGFFSIIIVFSFFFSWVAIIVKDNASPHSSSSAQ